VQRRFIRQVVIHDDVRAPAVALCTMPHAPPPPPDEEVAIPGRTFHWRLWLNGVVFALAPPFTLNRLRRGALQACGVRVGRGTHFWGNPVLVGPGDVAARLSVGRYCGFNIGSLFDLAAPVTIGNHVSVGHDVRFLTREAASGSVSQGAPIGVGDGAWIGARCTILAGVNIGPGAVIGAGLTVAADVPAHTLVTGSQTVSLARWR
jgi:maltose O-acetyltransferase